MTTDNQKRNMTMVKSVVLAISLILIPLTIAAQPARSRVQRQQGQPASQGQPAQPGQPATKLNGQNITTRAQISFPTQATMSEDVVWRRDIYREISLKDDANAGLYYPVEPMGTQMNLFTYIFKLMMTGQVKAYKYNLDGNEVFNDSNRLKPLEFLDNYHIYYERVNGRVRLDDSDIPSREVTAYYLKESAYYDQANSTFHTKVLALCPIMEREDDFGDASTKYPLFWIKYDDIAPFLAKQTIMTSNLNNAATMSVDDYFAMNRYKGKIYKTTNMLGLTLAQYCPTDSAMLKEQQRIESELKEFETHVWGQDEKTDSIDSIAGNKDTKVTRTTRRTRTPRTRTPNANRRTRNNDTPASTGAPARVTARRQRH